MPATEGFNRIFLIVFLEFVSFDRFNAQSRSCYEVADQMVCYFQPNELYIEMTWDDAWTVCKENNSTLPVIENRILAETFKRHLESKTPLSREMWLAGREIRANVWQWLNGKQFGRQNFSGTSQTSYETNAVIRGKQEYWKSYPGKPSHFICHYKDSKLCQNKSIITWENGCLFVNNDEELDLADARNRCLDEGGDLATFEEDERLTILQQNSSLLHSYREYWIGLRQNWWIWNDTDSPKEIKYSNWLKYKNLLNKECLCINLYDYKWNQDNCKTRKPFLCQSVHAIENTHGYDDQHVSTTYVDVSPTRGQPNIVVFLVAGVSILVLTILLVVVIVAVIIKIRKTRQQQNDVTCVQTDGSYQDLRRGRDNMRSDDPYMELQGIAHQQTPLNPDYQNLSDYDYVAVPHVPNYLNIVQ